MGVRPLRRNSHPCTACTHPRPPYENSAEARRSYARNAGQASNFAYSISTVSTSETLTEKGSQTASPPPLTNPRPQKWEISYQSPCRCEGTLHFIRWTPTVSVKCNFPNAGATRLRSVLGGGRAVLRLTLHIEGRDIEVGRQNRFISVDVVIYWVLLLKIDERLWVLKRCFLSSL